MFGWQESEICVPAPPNYQSVGYGFITRKRWAATYAAGMGCGDPNAYGLEDGTTFNLKGLDEGLVADLVGYEVVVSVADVPEAFKEYQM